MKHKEIAVNLFKNGCNCSQAVFGAYTDVTGLDKEYSLKLSSPFGGGLGRLRLTCGALIGMLSVIGVKLGNAEFKTDIEKGEYYTLIQKATKEFENRLGSVNCSELLKDFNPSNSPIPTPRTLDFYKTRPCINIIEVACDILDELLKI